VNKEINKMGIKPVGDRIILKNVDNYKGNSQGDLLVGEIMDMQDTILEDTNDIWYEINIGDKVVFRRGAGVSFYNYYILKSQEILGIVEDEEDE
jgi:co-chaperonin GroES (HSP10)